MNNTIIAKITWITILKDKWLIENNKMSPDLKIRLKKVKNIDKKQLVKLDKFVRKLKKRLRFMISDELQLAISK